MDLPRLGRAPVLECDCGPLGLTRRLGRPLGTIAVCHRQSILRHLPSDLAQNLRNDIVHRPTHVHHDWILVRVGLLQDCEDTVEELQGTGSLFSRRQARNDQRPLAVQINKTHFWPTSGQKVAMAAPEQRAGDHSARAKLPAAIDPRRDLLEPGPPVAVIE